MTLKTSLLRFVFSALAFPTLTLAQGAGGPPPGGPGGPGGGGPGGHGGGPPPGQQFTLVATASAPAGAQGHARIGVPPPADNGSSVSGSSSATAAASTTATPPTPELLVQVTGLVAGTYTVSVTVTAADSSNSTDTLGTFDVTSTTGPTQAALALPTGTDPRTITAVQILDATSTVLLSGSAGPGANAGAPHSDFRLVPTAAAPAGAGGQAHLNNTVATALTLDLSVRNLAADTYTVSYTSKSTQTSVTLGTFTVAEAGTATSASLALASGTDPTDLTAVQVADSTGTVVLSGDGDCRGGAVNGAEHLRETATLAATTNAPTGAAGNALLDATTVNGATHAILSLRTKGLATGTYTVNTVSASTSAVTALGTFTVDSDGHGGIDFGTPNGTAFPDGFNPLDIGTVQVADAGGTVLLSGDLTSAAAVTGGTFTARVKTTAGSAAPASVGSATIAAHTVAHTVRQTFALTAKGAPANTTLTVKVNGVTAGQVKTSRTGSISIGGLPAGTSANTVTSVTLDTASGQRVLGAYF